MNKKAKNKLLCGDSCTLLDSIEDCTIDLVITDPPYGMNYISARSEYSDSITKTGIMNDDSNALEIFKCVMEKLNNKTKPDAGFYVFCSWKTYPDFKLIVEQYAEIKNLIIWDKGNHGAGDLDHAWGNKYECIIYATKDSRKLNIRMQDIITVPRVNSTLARHPTQKPVELITKLLTASARKQDVVCDPFMGSGATIKAVKEYGDLNYIGIELDESIFKKTCIWIGGDIDG
jgi:site-specific DNA-methyltransferase (adenine-specific)